MPQPAGLFDTGLVILTQPEILSIIEADQRANVSNEIDQSAATLVGNYNGIVSDSLAIVWELVRDVYNSQFPNLAAGYSLSQLVQLSRTKRNAATYSNVTCEVNVDAGTYPAGSLIAITNGNAAARWYNAEDVTNAGPGAADIEVVFRAEVTGPQAGPSGSLVIAEPFTGWNSVTNAEDAEKGKPIESDADLRRRRELELASGSSTADAVRSAILRELSDEGVTSVRVLLNDGDVTNADGVLPHSLEPIVLGPESPTAADDERLADVIRLVKADGIRITGSTIVTRYDAQGNVINIGFTRPDEVDIWVRLDLSVDAATYAGEDAVKAVILAYILNPGDDVSFFKTACLPFGVAGVKDVITPGSGIGTSGFGSVDTAPIAIGIREIARFDSSRIQINIV